MNAQLDITEVIEPNAISASITKVQGEVAAFDKIAAGIASIAKAHPKDLVIDVTTTAGMRSAIAARAAWREPRIAVEKARKAAKAPVLDLGKQIDSFAAGLESQLREGEDNYDRQIKAEEARKEVEKAAKAEAERRRVALIQDRIANDITGAVRGAVGRSFSEISAILSDVGDIVIGEQFEEFQSQAHQAKSDAMDQLREMQAEALAREKREAEEKAQREAEAARLAAEREELTRLRAEQAERERVAAEARAAEEKAQAALLAAERAKQEAELRAQREAQERELAAQREAQAKVESEACAAREVEEKRLAAERAELKRQQEEAEAARLAEFDRQQKALKKLHQVAPMMLDALRQWRSAELSGDKVEMDNARKAREEALAAASI